MARFTDKYQELKNKYPADVLILVQVERDGEAFFEAYNEDAQTIGDELGFYVVTLNGISITGFPEAQIDKVIAKLIANKHRIALCDEPVLIDMEEDAL